MLEEKQLTIFKGELKEVFQSDPLRQNIVAVMAVLREPVDADDIANLASNPDGETKANKIEVTIDDVRAFIELIKKIEQSSKLNLLEEKPLNNEVANTGFQDEIQERKIGYRFSDDFRNYVKHEHPELCRIFHEIVATKLLDVWQEFKKNKFGS